MLQARNHSQIYGFFANLTYRDLIMVKMVPVPLAYQPPFQYPASVQYAAAPPPPPIPQYVQPAYHPEIRFERWSDP